MPSIKLTPAKGLFQTGGTSTIQNGTITGDLTSVHPTVLEGVAALTASVADSGRTFVFGGAGGNTVMALPEMSTTNIGFKCELIVTGALSNSIVVETQTASTSLSSDSDRFLLSLALIDGNAQSDKLTTSTNKLTFVNGGADAGDACVVEVRYIGANKAIVKGNVLT